jgi:hypothetical protein
VVGLCQQFGVFALHLAEDAHAQARARERMAVDHVARQAEGNAEPAHLVLEQFAQRLDQAELHVFRQAADIVVALDHMRLAGLAAGRLDHVRVDRALRQPLRVGELLRLLVEDLDEQVADDLALGFRDPRPRSLRNIGRRRSRAGPSRPCSANIAITWSPSFSAAGRCRRTRRSAVADRAMQQRGDDRGIDATGQPQDDLVVADLRAHAGDLVFDDVGGGPQCGAAADVRHEAAQHQFAGWCG